MLSVTALAIQEKDEIISLVEHEQFENLSAART
jgi:hypothetical protein